MSGPKCSQVTAALDVIQSSAQRCSNRLAKGDCSAIEGLVTKARTALRQTAQELESISVDSKRSHPILQAAPGNRSRTTSAISRGREYEQAAAEAIRAAEARLEEANRLQRQAAERAEQGQAAYRSARAALRASRRQHNRDSEMAMASSAAALFGEAEALLRRADEARSKARQQAEQALSAAVSGSGAADEARRALARASAEVEARAQAEERARREMEEQRRKATSAISSAEAVLTRIRDLPLGRIKPAGLEHLSEALRAAQQALNAGKAQRAGDLAKGAEEALGVLEQELIRQLAHRRERRARAQAALDSLAESLAAVDSALVQEWATDPQQVERVQSKLEKGRRSLAEDQEPEDILSLAEEGASLLASTVASAAENAAAGERRHSIGIAVMEVLREMGFDVSFQEGSRSEPMRIAGQTPDEAGRGDFDVSIPLDGEVDFSVDTPRGDRSCVAAVEELQRRLAERGVTWEVTNWGHAEPEGPPQAGKGREPAKERDRSRHRNQRPIE